MNARYFYFLKIAKIHSQSVLITKICSCKTQIIIANLQK